MPAFHVIIPARYHSTRLPGKVLQDIHGKTMLQRVYEKAMESGAEDVIIATDHQKVAQAAEGFGATVCMTSENHQSGTERISEAVVALGLEDDEIIVCLQADAPMVPCEIIRDLAEDLVSHDNVKVASVCRPINKPADLFNPNMVKVVLNHRNYATYFSRAPIPWDMKNFADPSKVKISDFHYHHIGIYAYRAGFLQEYLGWDPCPAEKLESLEQLRVLYQGARIHMIVTEKPIPPDVNTQEDLDRVRKLFKD